MSAWRVHDWDPTRRKPGLFPQCVRRLLDGMPWSRQSPKVPWISCCCAESLLFALL